MKIPFKTSLRLAFHGKWERRIITIILSAFAFVLFALGSMGFTYSYSDFLTRGYLNYTERVSFISFNGANGKNMSIEDVEDVEQETGLSFVYHSAGFNWGQFIGSQIGQEGKISEESDLYQAWRINGLAGVAAIAGNEEDYVTMGYSLLAGKYPTEKNEIAISEAHFESFMKYGYCNVAKNFIYIGQSDGILSFSYDYNLPRGEIIPVMAYEDMLGKTFGYGDPDRDEKTMEYKIVGIVQTNYEYRFAEEYGFEHYPAAHIMRPAQWKSETDQIHRIFTGEVNEYKTMKKCVDTVLAFKERAESEGKEYETTNYPMLYHMDTLIPSRVLGGYQDTDIIAFMIGAAGIVLGIFAAVLNGYLVSQSIQSKQKKIGIIRSSGADKKAVSKIFILESFMTATAIFLLSLISSLTIYYGFVRQLTTYQSFGVSFLVYNGWTALILATVCYIVPLISTLFPLKKFFKQTIVDNLSGNYKKKKL